MQKVFDKDGNELTDPRSYDGKIYNDKGKQLCGARTKNKENPWVCLRTAGWGVPDKSKGNGKCSYHGGKGGAPKNNTNAVTHGYYQKIIVDKLDDDEAQYFTQETLDKIAEIDNEIKLLTIREGRMLENYNQANANIRMYALDLSNKAINLAQYEKKVDKMEERKDKIEELLTRIQKEKGRFIEIKHRLETDVGVDDDKAQENMQKLIDVLTPKTSIFDDEDGDDDEA